MQQKSVQVEKRISPPSSFSSHRNSFSQTTKKQVLPSRTIYAFEEGDITLTLEFFNTFNPTNWDELSRPLTYVTINVTNEGNSDHDIEIYFDLTGEFSVNTVDEYVVWERTQTVPFNVMRMGTAKQPIFQTVRASSFSSLLRFFFPHCQISHSLAMELASIGATFISQHSQTHRRRL
jgi:hypothetical protein